MRFVRIASFRILVFSIASAGIATAPAFAESNFAQTKLKAFVTAMMAVDELMQKWTPRIRNAGKEEVHGDFAVVIRRHDLMTTLCGSTMST